MQYLLLLGVLGLELVAFANRGGGPLVSHLALTGATCVLAGVWGYRHFYKNRASLSSWQALTVFAYFLFLLFFVISLGLSLTPTYGLSELLLFANGGILFLIFSQTKFEEKDLQYASTGLIFLTVANVLVGYFIYLNHPFPRFAGTFLDLSAPYTSFGNDFANFLLLILPLSIGKLFKKYERHITSFLFVLFASLLLSAFILTFSRGAWISGIMISVIGLGWMVYNRRGIPGRLITARIVGVIFLTVLLVTALQYGRSKKFETVSILQKATLQSDEGNASVSERFFFWDGAIKIIRDYPLFGTGVQSFRYIFPRYQTVFGITWDHPHNILLKMGVENGIFAAISFFAFLVLVAIFILKFLLKNPLHQSFFFVLGAFGALAHNFMDFNFIVSNFTLFIVFIGIAASCADTYFYSSDPTKKTPSLFVITVMILSVALGGLGLREGIYNNDFKNGRAMLASGNLDLAIPLLEKSQHLIFPRDTTNYLSLAYRKKFDLTQNKVWQEKERNLLEEETMHSIDATLFSRLSDIYVAEGDFQDAYKMAFISHNLDPQNRLKYYFQILDIAKKHPQAVSPSMKLKEDVLLILSYYLDALRENRHVTILSDNPYYASQLYYLLGDTKGKQELDAAWAEQYEKFRDKYVPISKALLY